MKAIVLKQYGAPHEAFEMQERPTPQPGDGQVRIAVEAKLFWQRATLAQVVAQFQQKNIGR